MDAERYARLRTLFDAVIDEPAEERRALLDAVELDAAVIDEVLELIVQSERRNTEQLGKPLQAALSQVTVEAAPGDQFGVWRVERELGRGGMGAVYLVQRDDGHFRQTAALKFIRGSAEVAAVAYFTRERQLLATLAHPQIARLLDGGATVQGRPYLVMEYIDGMPIDAYCKAHSLGHRAVLELFASASAAVAFAHRQLVVHCDLKPSNLLVTGEGRPVLLDFGIAQLVDRVGGDSGAPTDGADAPAAAAYTPRYASPEQREGRRVTVASDIYSLGTVLRELLTLAADVAAIGPELAALLAKATHADADRRYVSVDALCDDIAAFLARRPLRAVPATAPYRARKFVQRRWPWLLAAAVFALTVMAFSAKVVIESRRARIAEQSALAERDRALLAEAAARASEVSANEVSDFLTSVFNGANPDAGTGNIPTGVLVDQAVARVEQDLSAQPATRSQMYAALAGVQEAIEQPQRSIASYERAIAIERGLQRPLVLARMLMKSAAVRLKFADGPQQMLNEAREALQLVERHGQPDSPLLVDAMTVFADVLGMHGDPKQATQVFERAMALARRIEPGSRRLAFTVGTAGWYFGRNGDLDRATQLLSEQLTLLAKVVGERDMDYQGALETLASTYGQARRFEESETAFRKLIDLRRATGQLDSDYGAWSLSQFGRMLTSAGRPLEAIQWLRESVAISERKLADDGVARGVLLNLLGTAADRAGDYALAESSFRAALAILDKVWKEDRASLALIRHKFGASLLRAGKRAEATVRLRLARDQYVKHQPHDNVDLLEARLSYADALRQNGDVAAADAELDAIAAHVDRLLPPEAARLAHLRALVRRGQVPLADTLKALIQSETQMRTALGDQDARSWLVRLDRAELLQADGQKTAASTMAAEVLSKVQPRVVPDSPLLKRIRRLL